jgi:hypothetical protein
VGGPVSFPQAHSSWTGCYAVVQVKDKEFQNVTDMTCDPVFKYTGS